MTATLADHKIERERIQAQRAEASARKAEAQVVRRTGVLRAGLAVRAEALQVLDLLLERWLLDVDGLSDETATHHAMSLAAHEVLTAFGEQVQRAAHALPELGKSFASGATPRRLLTVSQWAQEYRQLKSGTNSPGPWNNALTPYLTEIMDSLSEHSSVRQVTFIKSSGVGGTEAMYNWLGYVMHHLQNKDLLIVVPSLELRDRSLNPRIAKMLDETPELAKLVPTGKRDRANRAELLEYGARSRIIKAGANSPDSLRSDHLPYVICDEVDAFPWDVGSEGDPMTLIENRQRTFSRAKTYCVSTPTQAGASRIALLYSRSDQRTYHVPCPHCGEAQALEFGGKDSLHGLKWRTHQEPGEPEQVVAAWYVCRHCGAEIEEKHKPDMLAAGRWVAQHPSRKLHRGYFINALYAPTGLGLGWVDIAKKWLEVQGDTSELKAFTNTYLGEVWSELGDSIEAASLITRLEQYPDELATILCTAGVDVQKDRLEATIADWDSGEQCWVRDHHILPGDTTQPQVWDDLAELLKDERVQLACVDSGYNATAVHAFCASRPWCVPTKGMSGFHRPLVEDEKRRAQRLRVRRKRGQPVEPIGVDTGKALLYARLKLPAAGPGYVHFPALPAFDDEYFAQLAAEKLVTKVRGTRPFSEWVQTRPRNEALDCLLLNLAAFRLAALLVARGFASVSQPRKPAEAPPPAPSRTTQRLQEIQRQRLAARRR